MPDRCGGSPGKPGTVIVGEQPKAFVNWCSGCPDCRPCERCGGKGYYKTEPPLLTRDRPCPRCQGTGTEPTPDREKGRR